MRAISLKCPNCAANIRAEEAAVMATCEYCGTQSKIQQRTRFLERRINVPNLPALAATMPVATQLHSKKFPVIILVLFALPLLMGPVVFFAAKKSGVIPGFQELRWDGVNNVATIDLNGDGVLDIVGRLSRYKPEPMSTFLGAYDGQNGAELWTSERIAARTDALATPLGVAKDVVVMATGPADLIAIRTSDGSTAWRATIPEKVEQICRGEAGQVLVRAADKMLYPLSTDSGAIGEAIPGESCEGLPTDSDRRKPQHDIVMYDHWDDDKYGLEADKDHYGVDESMRHLPTGALITLAYKQPGSRVPMLIRYRWPDGLNPGDQPAEADTSAPNKKIKSKKIRKGMSQKKLAKRRQKEGPEILWTVTVPSANPLKVAEGALDPEEIAINDSVVVALYSTKASGHEFSLTAFALDSGSRLWEIKVPSDRPHGGLRITPAHAMVSVWGTHFVYDIKTGKLAYKIGE